MCGRGLAARHRSPGKGKPSGQGRAERGREQGGGRGGRRRDALEPARKQQERIPRFLLITRPSLPRSGRDKERGTAPHNKARRARRALAGRWGEHYTHGPPNATGNSLPYTRTQPTQAADTQQHHNKR